MGDVLMMVPALVRAARAAARLATRSPRLVPSKRNALVFMVLYAPQTYFFYRTSIV